ncbi:MAG: oxidoreductase [Chitinophagaceae bacterium]|nr:oxidoreductase [Chitinophagaceae bacterium]
MKHLYKILFIWALICSHFQLNAQELQVLTSGNKTSIRGLSVVDNNIVWASGSNGMVARSVDAGKNFNWIQVPNFEKKDFRDIEAFDSNTAIIMCITEPAFILKTIDGGKNWRTVFFDSTKGMFLDAMYFKDEKNGVVIGDPINNKPFIATTQDAGETWTTSLNFNSNSLKEGEAFFASSGTNIQLFKNNTIYVSGGTSSNLYLNEQQLELPIIQGIQSTGANSISIIKNKAIIVGGDFTKDSTTTQNCVLVNLKTLKVTTPKTPPSGYRSCVTFIHKNKVIACGLNGIDLSEDEGMNWKKISSEGFHVVQKAKKGNAIFLAGSKGRIAKLIL